MKLPIDRDNLRIPKIKVPKINLEPLAVFFTSKFFKIYIAILILITLIISSIIITIKIVETKQIKSVTARLQNFEEFSQKDIDVIRLNDLEIPNFFKGKNEKAPIFYRKRLQNWSQVMIDDFKENPCQISIEILEQDNDNKINELFKNIN